MRTAIITGGGRGLGAAIAVRLAADGYRVGVVDLSLDDATQVAVNLPDSLAIAADVTDEAAVMHAFDLFGVTPDLVVNNAGIVRFGALIDQSVEDFRAVVGVNLIGAFIVARTAALRMRERGSGHIINITSINALAPGPNAGAYPAAKAGLAQLTRHLALELGPLGIRVNAIAPGFIDGGMSEAIFANPRIRELRSNGVPLRRLGVVDDVANAVAFLDSPAAAYINGHELVVDGGVVSSVLAQLPRQ